MKKLGMSSLAFCLITSFWQASAETRVEIKGPNDRIRFDLLAGDGRLAYAINIADRQVIAKSPLGIVVDGVDLGRIAQLGQVESYESQETYATRGVHSRAVNHFKGARVQASHGETKADFTIDVRVFDDGAAFRIIVPDVGRERVPDEATAFRLVGGSTVWYHNLRGHYEGVHAKKPVADVKAGEWAAPPLTVKLPDGLGYAAITEANLGGFAGMALQADGDLGFAARLGHAHPASYPFTLRYKEDVERLARPASLKGAITSPWRVVMVGADLNTLVNCDIVQSVSPPPDPVLFPKGLDTGWLKPGRAVWKFLDGGENSLAGMKEFSRLAGELGFEYNVIEGFWQRWTDAQLRELVDDSKAHGVGIWLWKHSKDLRTPQTRQAFFRKCKDAGAVGAKIDFFDHEAKEVVDLYPLLLREAALHQLMVDFHGANKPTGESRTWPNELGREGVYGLEHKGMTQWAANNTTLPFTRFLAGPGDYTPVHFGDRRRETSWPHQIASAAIMTSPLLVYAAHPQTILTNPAVDMIKSIPSVWDETIVLPPSEIGELAAFARRHGDRWFLAVLNGPTARSVHVPARFLGSGRYGASIIRERSDDPAAVKIEESSMSGDDSIDMDLRAGGGFIARFTKL
jgi:alpha-glucosidase